MSEQLIGQRQVVMTTDQLLADTLQAKESIALRSDMTLAWDERSASTAVLTSTPEQLAALRSTSARPVEIMQSAPGCHGRSCAAFHDCPAAVVARNG
ncbi:hypothetical protein F3K40_00780 [Streptomyces sp. LBUM 1478]|nr:hypothetical protein [Streptomyces sp. LBUM 1478]